MARVDAEIVVRLEDFPETLAALRAEMANLLREEAKGEPEFVVRKLEECALAFETGIRGDAA